LTTVLQLLHENLLPAIDRCAIILSRLRGLAKYHDESSGWIFNTPVTTFTSLLTLLKNLRLLAHTTLLYASDEKRHFASFSKWLRYEIDFEATEPDSQSRAEMEGRDPGVDVSVVLDYIRYGLMKSDLTPYLRPESELSTQQRNEEATSYEDTLKAIDLLKDEALYKEQALCLDHVLGHFTSGCTTLFQQISAWQQANTSMDSALILTPDFDAEGSAALDMRMVFSVCI
jgi:anaphase-promoting complex subunit 4